MLCVQCGSKTRVTNSRPAGRYGAVKRWRRCEKCSHEFTTFELTEEELKSTSWWERLRRVEDDLDRVKKTIHSIRRESEIG